MVKMTVMAILVFNNLVFPAIFELIWMSQVHLVRNKGKAGVCKRVETTALSTYMFIIFPLVLKKKKAQAACKNNSKHSYKHAWQVVGKEVKSAT